MQDERLVVGDYASRGREGFENPCVVGCAHLYLGSVFVMGEGLGSPGSGRVESRLAVSAALTHFRSSSAQDPRQRLVEAIQHASSVLHHRSQTGPAFSRSFARCVVVLVRRGRLYAARVGNISVLVFGPKGARSLFLNDPSEVEVMVGQDAAIDVEVYEQDLTLAKGDRFLLANASLFAATTEEELSRLATGLVPAVAARRLVELADRIEGAGPVSVQIVQAGAAFAAEEPAGDRHAVSQRATVSGTATIDDEPDSVAVPEPMITLEAPRRQSTAGEPARTAAVDRRINVPRVLEPSAWPTRPILESDKPKSRPAMPPSDLLQVDLDRPASRASARWLGGVGLVAGLAVAFSYAFPRPSRSGTDVEDAISIQTDVAAAADGDTNAMGKAVPVAAPGPSATSLSPSATAGSLPTGAAAVAFWTKVSEALDGSPTTPDAETIVGWLSTPSDRGLRIREAKAVLDALDSSAWSGAAPSVPTVDPSEPAIARADPTEPAPAPADPPTAPSTPAVAQTEPAAEKPTVAEAKPVPAEPSAPGKPVEVARSAVSPGLRPLERLFAIKDSTEAGRALRDYIHHRHDKVDEVFARLDAYAAVAPPETLRRVLPKVLEAQPGPRTRKWVKDTLRKVGRARN